MKKNLSNADRVIRLIIAAIVVSLYVGNVITGTLGVVLMIVAGILAITSFVSFCPLYFMLHIRTNKSIK